jgi:transposase-like protein
VEDLLAERGLDVSYESVRRWVLKFGPLFARELRRSAIGRLRSGISTRVCREGFRNDVVAELHGR